MRIYELAKKWGLDSKEFVTRLQAMGYKIKNHMSTLDDELIDRIERKLFPDKFLAKEAAKKQAEKKTAPPPEPPKKAEDKPQTEAPTKESKAPSRPEVTATAEMARPAVPVTLLGPFRLEFPITVAALSEKTGLKPAVLIKSLIDMGIFATVNQLISKDIVMRLGEKMNFLIEKTPAKAEEVLEKLEEKEDPKKLVLRPPVVTMMGHVDHGKTSLLDAIRSTNVASREAGRITQHIGAYGVDIPGKGHITFLDTPGHEAFSAMRARGANVTDVVVLVVAADDGVMPQTVEAINHAKAAEVSIVVAVNKCDLPSANPDKVKAQLQKMDLAPEDWGGKTIFVHVSAKTGDGIDKLLEMLVLESEILELKANPNRKASGTVIESKLSKGRGPVATVLVQQGTLTVGDAVVCGLHYGKIRAMTDDKGRQSKSAGPSYAVEIQGLNGVPNAGDKFFKTEDEREAREISEKRSMEFREETQSGKAGKHLTLDALHSKIAAGEIRDLKIIIKADVQGSIEALTGSLEKISTNKIQLRVIHGAVGGINESDVVLAAASNAIIIGFHVKPDLRAQELIDKEKVDVRFYNIIYEAVDDIKKAMEGKLAPTLKEVVLGTGEIRETFKISKIGTIAGAHVLKGKIVRNAKARLIRDNIIIYDGKLASLKRFKDDAREVEQGYDCGTSFENFNDIKVGDRFEAYRIEESESKL